jgi:nitroimidazol reductase NimA-like FMN-containing flavoprotein (pyridoxamine 5'-phosphate oxidase superfamily)
MANDRATDIGPDGCAALLAQNHFGRVAVNDDDGPIVLPVNYVLDGDGIVFRSAEGTKVHAALHEAPASFEIDAIDERTRTGWSVVVRGHLAEITDAGELARVRGLPLRPFVGGDRERFVRLEVREVSGRRIDVPEGVPEGWFRPTGLGNVWLGRDAADLGL